MKTKGKKGSHLRVVPSDDPNGQKQGGGDSGGGGSSVEERLARLEARMDYLSTKADIAKIEGQIEAKISNLKNWILGGVIAAIVIASGLAATIASIFIN